MADAGMSFILMLAVLTNGGDLLDYIASADFWQEAGVQVSVANLQAELAAGEPDAAEVKALIVRLGDKDHAQRQAATDKLRKMGPPVLPQLRQALSADDPEVVERLKEVIAALDTGSAQAKAVRRLMAIRALGESKAREALPTLQSLLKSKAAFEADYAARAIAAVEGKPWTEKSPADGMAADLQLLPANCGVVGQMVPPATSQPDLPGLLKDIAGPAGINPPPPGMGGRPVAEFKMHKRLIQLAGRVGNVRFHGLTLGVADNIGNNVGYVVVIARGQYDRAAMRAALLGGGKGPGRNEVETIDKSEVIWLEREAGVVLASDDRLVFMVGAGAGRDQIPAQGMIAALAAGKGKFAENAAMAKLVASADRNGPYWAAMLVGESYARAPQFAGIKSMVLTSKAKAGQIDATVSAEGPDAEKLKQSADQLTSDVAQIGKEIGQEVQRMPALQPFADFLASVQIRAEGLTATATGQYKGKLQPLALTGTVFVIQFSRFENMAGPDGPADDINRP